MVIGELERLDLEMWGSEIRIVCTKKSDVLVLEGRDLSKWLQRREKKQRE